MATTTMFDIDRDRLTGELAKLATFSDAPAPAVTRIVYSPTDLAARDYLRGLYEDAGLDVRVDAIGNTFARWAGSEPDAPVVGTGSHTDALPHAGAYDGTVGLLGGLEAIRALQRADVRPKRSIELLMFTAEEPTRFDIGCIGSRAMSGQKSPDDLRALRDDTGDDLETVRQRAGFKGSLDSVPLPGDYYHAWVELHIEQGQILERAGLDIGVVTAIAAPAALNLTVEGEGGHAGGVLMKDRRDALCAASEIVLALEALSRSSPSPDAVGTAGVLDIHPGAVNSIPRRVTIKTDIRDTDAETRDEVIQSVRDAAQTIARQRGVTVTDQLLHADVPATCDERIIESIENACEACGLSHRRMISRAYHDSLFMAPLSPIGMIFIPCRDGVSHRPDEYASPEHIARGAAVLAKTLADLAVAD